MKLIKLLPFFLIMILLCGCNKAELNWYGIVVFKPVEAAELENTWSAEILYIDYSETEETPPDVLRITYNNEDAPAPEEVIYEIPGTDIEGMIRLSEDGSGEAVIDRTQLVDYISTIIREDGTITNPIPLVLKWGNQTEHHSLPYLTAVKDFERSGWDKLLQFFS